ncbi:MAG: Lrp/AsnC family transcriptional regulator [Verrucomicrobiota bacterium]|nr:Lrp/AsnC family transcriptional regulator [Verrucomicrobiota bacterium]
MDELLKILRDNASLSHAQLAGMLNSTEADVAAKIESYEKDEVILGYRTVLNEDKLNLEIVRAVIEVKITPEREGGFDRVALRISKFNEVHSCYLMSGGYDLLVIVEGIDLRTVSTFVAEKLATMSGVISTATHFLLKPYKEHGILTSGEYSDEKLAVTP